MAGFERLNTQTKVCQNRNREFTITPIIKAYTENMSGNELRTLFLKFFEEKGHTVVPSSSLIPDDPSVLLTTAGMQQFKPYYAELDAETTIHPSIGKPIGKNVCSVQKCFRISDIDEVGDESHLSFFEMLGNFSFGGYFKEEAIKYGYEFIAEKLGLKISYASVFEGDKEVPRDEESERIWKSLGVEVRHFGREDNFWGPTGKTGPCGPTTEIYVKNKGGNDIEIWNIVFNEYEKKENGSLEKLSRPGVDTGMGLERLAMVSQNVPTVFDTDLLKPITDILPTSISSNLKIKRIITDHIRSISFLLADGIKPSNKDRGYVLRRMLRRLIVHEYLNSHGSFSGNDILGIGKGIDIENWMKKVIQLYSSFYPELKKEKNIMITEFKKENEQFRKILISGVRELRKMEKVDIKSAFDLYQSFGLPYEVIKDMGGEKTAHLTREDFDREFEKHQEISRAGIEKKFGGHGLVLDTGELKAGSEEELKKVTRLHTATHLLQQALREVLGDEARQEGSDITTERARFDFSFPRKLTPEEISRVEGLVNKKIEEDLPVSFKEMKREDAEKTGALHFFKAKYPDTVKVYFVGDSIENAWSKEFCGGPHVSKTGEIGKFRIKKEESVAAGIRRIRGVVE